MRKLSLWAALVLGPLVMYGCPTSVDPQTPRAYPCSLDSGVDPSVQCPGGWTCGLEGYCHAPDAPYPYACHDDSHCAPTWRCGLDGFCHDRAVGAAYLCESDSDCEQGWRCSVDARCVSATSDALRGDAGFGPLSFTRLSPLLSTGYADLVSAGRPDASADAPEHVYAVVHGGQLVQVHHYPAGRLEFVDGGLSIRFADRFQTPLPSGADALATFGAHSYVLNSEGLLKVSGGAVSSVSAEVRGKELRLSPEPDSTLLVAFDEQSYSLVDPTQDKVLVSGAALPAADGGRQRIHDMLPASSVKGSGPRVLWVLAAGEEGLFVARRAPTGELLFADGGVAPGGAAWEPTQFSPMLPNQRCGAPPQGGITAQRLHFNPASPYLGFGVQALEDASRVGIVSILANEPFSPCGNPYGFTTLACSPCPPGYSVADVHPYTSVPPSLTVGCVDPTGQHKETYRQLRNPNDGGCWAPTRVNGFRAYDEPARVNRSVLGYPTFHGPQGQIWAGPNLEPLTLDRATTLVSPLPPFGLRAQVEEPPFATRYFFEASGVGLVKLSNELQFTAQVAAVDGRTHWGVLTDEEGAPERVAALDQTSSPIATFPFIVDAAPPYSAQTFELPDGGTELVVSVFDKLLAAELGSDGGAALLEIKAVPQPYSPILSVALSSPALTFPDGGQPLVTGYVLTRNRLFALVAATQKLWDTREVTVPEGDWLRVWFDGQRGRIGYASGAVYALPSRVPLATALPEGEQLKDFVQLCGATYALSTRSRLLRLEAPAGGGPLGTWAELDVSAALAPGADPGLAEGSLQVVGGELMISTSHGVVLRAHPAGCRG